MRLNRINIFSIVALLTLSSLSFAGKAMQADASKPAKVMQSVIKKKDISDISNLISLLENTKVVNEEQRQWAAERGFARIGEFESTLSAENARLLDRCTGSTATAELMELSPRLGYLHVTISIAPDSAKNNLIIMVYGDNAVLASFIIRFDTLRSSWGFMNIHGERIGVRLSEGGLEFLNKSNRHATFTLPL